MSEDKKVKRVKTKKVKNKVKKLGVFDYLNPKNLKSQIKAYGGDFDKTFFIKYLGVMYVLAGLLSYFFQLHTLNIVVVFAVITLFIPGLFVIRYKGLFEVRRFEEVSSYMDQMLYSFRKKNKILSALEDTLSLFEEKSDSIIYQTILSTIKHIQTGDEVDIYEKAFIHMETVYDCDRMKKMHKFLIMVENAGGDCKRSIDILIKDKVNWVDRMNMLMKERKRVRVNAAICIGMAFIICLITSSWIPEQFAVIDDPISQWGSTAVIIINFLIWYYLDYRLSESIISKEKAVDVESVIRSYDIVNNWDEKKARKKTSSNVILGVVVTVILSYFTGTAGLVAGVIFTSIMATDRKRYLNLHLKRMRNHAQKAFPDWLMGVSLRLQSGNLFTAMTESLGDADEVTRKELQIMLDKLAVEPDSLNPFVDFYSYLDLPDVTSAMRMLYSIGAYGSESGGDQISALNERNIQLTNKAEQMKLEDDTAGLNIAVFAPMLVGTIKVMLDMVLMVIGITSSGLGTGGL